jgi:hypothetical protein
MIEQDCRMNMREIGGFAAILDAGRSKIEAAS